MLRVVGWSDMEFFEKLVSESSERRFVLLRKLHAAGSKHYEAPMSEDSSGIADDRGSGPGGVSAALPTRTAAPSTLALPKRNVYCLFDFVPTAADEVGLRAGDRVEVMSAQDADGWVQVRHCGCVFACVSLDSCACGSTAVVTVEVLTERML